MFREGHQSLEPREILLYPHAYTSSILAHNEYRFSNGPRPHFPPSKWGTINIISQSHHDGRGCTTKERSSWNNVVGTCPVSSGWGSTSGTQVRSPSQELRSHMTHNVSKIKLKEVLSVENLLDFITILIVIFPCGRFSEFVKIQLFIYFLRRHNRNILVSAERHNDFKNQSWGWMLLLPYASH